MFNIYDDEFYKKNIFYFFGKVFKEIDMKFNYLKNKKNYFKKEN